MKKCCLTSPSAFKFECKIFIFSTKNKNKNNFFLNLRLIILWKWMIQFEYDSCTMEFIAKKYALVFSTTKKYIKKWKIESISKPLSSFKIIIKQTSNWASHFWTILKNVVQNNLSLCINLNHLYHPCIGLL